MNVNRIVAVMLTMALLLTLAACGGQTAGTGASSAEASSAPENAQEPAEEPEEQAADTGSADTQESEPDFTCHIAGMKGPTGMGMVNMMAKAEETGSDRYQFDLYGAADEIVPLLVQGKIDMAAVPANLAATLYQKTDGEIEVMAVNTLGVLYVMSDGEDVRSLEDLRGKTVYSTGKGTTPEYILRYLLRENGIDPDQDLTIEYKSEAAEVVASLSMSDGSAIAILPQPYASAAQMQNEDLKVALSLTDEWDKVSDTPLITGVLVARKDFLQNNPGAVKVILQDYADSIAALQNDNQTAAQLCEQYGITAKAAIAEKALPLCNIVYLDGQSMADAVEGYLKVLYEAEPVSVGGTMPDSDFYYIEQE